MLKLTVVSASLPQAQELQNLDSFGKQDPFIRFSYRGKNYQTTVKNDGSKEPTWNEEFFIPDDV